MRIVVSNGFNRFHLAPLAAELHKHGLLSGFITGSYPLGKLRRLASTCNMPAVARFLDRSEKIPENLVLSSMCSEWIAKFGDSIFGRNMPLAQQRMHRYAHHTYNLHAQKRLSSLHFDIYHYRNCFGGVSASYALDRGKLTICDHSIGHPYAVSFVRRNEDSPLPEAMPQQPLGILEQEYLDDLSSASHFIVNSDFVKTTFTASGVSSDKVSVVYLGVDEKFLHAVDRSLQQRISRKPSSHLLFCGGFNRRKGAAVIMKSLQNLSHLPWKLTIAGNIEHDVRSEWETFYARFKDRVHYMGTVDRTALAALMSSFSVFVFPTLMEGSARVVFEALSAGCYVITTDRAGSIVKDGVHGSIVDPASTHSLMAAIKKVMGGDIDFEQVSKSNMQMVRDAYRQDQYGSKVIEVYHRLLSN